MLIVDDHALFADALKVLLDRDGSVHVVGVAHDGSEAVDLAVSTDAEVVLMDVGLPGMDGVQALACLRADAATAAIPVVALTAFAMKDDRERFLAAGFDGYLEKPISVRDLPGQVAALLTD